MNTYSMAIYEIVSETESNIYDVEKLIYTNRYKFTDNDFKIVSKQSLVILYSLWEGFIQNVFQMFLKEVNKNIQSVYELNDTFMLSQIESHFKQFQSYPTKQKSREVFHRKLSIFLFEENHQIDTKVNLKNNVGLEVLNNTLQAYGIEKFPSNWKQYSYPNRNLENTFKDFLHYRNNQAHGNNLTADVIVNHSEFEEYKNLVIDLLYAVSEKLISSLDEKIYLK